ncbi:UNKNOWN [Stylonychia lemnae]|uniref:Transmembrane protein n=1 Tax=Stylonychia lemnae TaxID=5949 RepID=A0A078AKS7_STYLE|nr:UNKNOWN [Stylonychia lemnae]|eukprot:CDW81398.1 UNKNOWN [Stylonychia lemnae]
MSNITPIINHKKSSTKKIEKQIFKFIKHIFKEHVQKVDQLDRKSLDIKMLIIYYTLMILELPHLSYFMIMEIKQNLKQDFFQSNKIKINLLYLLDQISEKDLQDSKDQQAHLIQMVKINELNQKLQNKIEITTNAIQQFWQNLYQEKSQINIYLEGSKISQHIEGIKVTYDDIKEASKDVQEIKFYIYMASFFKYLNNKETQQQTI